MPREHFAELNRGNDRPKLRATRQLTVPQELAIGRLAMSRMAASARKQRVNRTQPVLESLEGRQLLSGNAVHTGLNQAMDSAAGGFSQNDRVFTYITPTGGHALIKIVGVGNLSGTTVTPSGALEVLYGGTNAYSKIVGQVQGGGNRAPLASILNSQLVDTGQVNSLSGEGGNPLAAVLMKNFDLVDGGTINLTPGVTSLVLDSIGANTQVNLRTLPPAPSYRILPAAAGNTAGGQGSLFGLAASASTTVTGAAIQNRALSISSLSTSTTSSTTLEAGQSASITNAQGITTSYFSGGGNAQTLTELSGDFTATSNILEPLAAGQPRTEPPAPPGIILKTNRIGGAPTSKIDLLTDSKVFGYDPTTGQLVRFDLNLVSQTGAVDPTFTPISVPGDPANAGVNIAEDGTQLVVLVSSGSNVYAYNATNGAEVGSFTTTTPINSIASTATVTVLGSYQTNQLQMINLSESLQTGTEQPLGSALPFMPASEVTLLGGVTGVAGSNNIYGTIAAHFSTLQPNQTQLGIQSVSTIQVIANGDSTTVSTEFSPISHTALTIYGNNIPVQPNPQAPNQTGAALGSIDGSLALVLGAANGTNTVKLYSPTSLTSRGTINLYYSDLLTGLSESFRPNLTGSSLIDIQGDVQSIRGGTANGMVLNDNGNLALVKLQQLTNSTIVGQPISHLDIKSRSNDTVLSSAREVDNRNGVKVQYNIQQIGPLSQISE